MTRGWALLHSVLVAALACVLCSLWISTSFAASSSQLLQSARADFQAGRYAAASLEYEKLLRMNLPASQLNEILPSFCESTLREGKLAKAESLITVSRTRLSDPFALGRLAYLESEILYFKGDVTGAMGKYKDFVSANTESPFANDAIDRLLLMDENSDFDNKPLAAYSHAEFLEFSGNADSSLYVLRGILRDFPKSKIADDVHMKIGDILSSQKKFPDALEEYGVLEASFPKSELVPVGRLKTASIYSDGLNEKDRAVKEYEEIITAFPGTSFAAEARGALQKLKSGQTARRGTGRD